MSQQQKQPFWYRFFHSSNTSATSFSTLQNLNNITEIKIITENDLKIETILTEEFRFRGDFLKHISDNITSTFNLYFLFLGISISGISVTYQLTGKTLSSLQILAILAFIVFGKGNTLFFVRFISFIHHYQQHKAVLNDIREYYISHLRSQIPDITNVFRSGMMYSLDPTYFVILYTVFALVDSLSFAGAAFVLTELWLHIHTSSPLSLPSDSRPYIFALLIGIFAFLIHILFFRFTLYEHIKESSHNPSPNQRRISPPHNGL